MDMALHRYGGGLSRASMAELLAMPFRAVVRLVGAAVRAANAGKEDANRRSAEEERQIIERLKAKKNDLAAVAKAEAMQAARAARAAAAGGHR